MLVMIMRCVVLAGAGLEFRFGPHPDLEPARFSVPPFCSVTPAAASFNDNLML